ncbi:Transposase, partial [Rhodospirillales bacterium URHD0017]
QYVEEVLVPTLKPGDIVIFDNLGSHKGKAGRNAIRAAGAKLFFLTKYSPDLNPIEKFFAKLKRWLHKAARRTVDAVYHAIADILPHTFATECSNYFVEAGICPTSNHHALVRLTNGRTGLARHFASAIRRSGNAMSELWEGYARVD